MVSLNLIERRIDDKFKLLKDEIMNDYRELIEENDIYFDSSLQSTQRSDLFRLYQQQDGRHSNVLDQEFENNKYGDEMKGKMVANKQAG